MKMLQQCWLTTFLAAILFRCRMCLECPPNGTITNSFLQEQSPMSSNEGIICNFHTIEEDAFSNIRGFTYLTLTSHKQVHIPGGVFSPLSSTCMEDLTLTEFKRVMISRLAFTELYNLRNLYLTYNKITHIEVAWFADLSSLKRLELGHNNLAHIPDGAFEQLLMLQVLYLNSNELRNISNQTFSGLQNLQTLSLGRNKLTHIPCDVFAQLLNLTRLLLYDNELSQIADCTFEKLLRLKGLSLAGNKLTSISAEMFNSLQNLQELSLWGNNLTQVLDGVFAQLINLKWSLQLNSNQISFISKGAFIGLRNLRNLYLSRNRLKYVSDGVFDHLVGLQELHLGNNQLLTISDGAFSKLSNVKLLYLNGNQISQISVKTFTGLRTLQELNLRYNDISQIEDSAFFDLGHLKKLNIEFNRISHVTRKMFSGLNNIIQMYLTSNQISHIDDFAFYDLNNISDLFLYNNDLTTFTGNSFAFTSSSQKLCLDRNHIQAITQVMVTNISKNIITLGLSGNKITYVEEGSLKHLNLSALCLHDNLLQTIPRDIQEKMANGMLVDVSLGLNPLHCNCELEYIKNWETYAADCFLYDCMYRRIKLCRDWRYAYNISCTSRNIIKPMSTLSNVELDCTEPTTINISTNIDNKYAAAISCVSSGDPAPFITWQLPDGNKIKYQPSKNKIIYTNSAVLEISTPGEYTCNATNIAGSTMKKINITQSDIIKMLLRKTVAKTGGREPLHHTIPLIVTCSVLYICMIVIGSLFTINKVRFKRLASVKSIGNSSSVNETTM